MWIQDFSLPVHIHHTAVSASSVLEQYFPPLFLCMQANPSVLIHRSDARLLILAGHEIQLPLSFLSYLQVTLKMYCTVLYVAIKIYVCLQEV